MYGPYFLAFYAGIIGAAILLIWQQHKKRFNTGDEPHLKIPADPDPYEIAYARNGRWEVGKLAVFDLLKKGYLKSTVNDNKTKVLVRKSSADLTRDGLHPAELIVYDHFGKTASKLYEVMDNKIVLKRIEDSCAMYRDRLEENRIITTEEDRKRWRKFKWMITGVVVLVGVYKFLAAANNGHSNVGFLVLMMFAAAFVLPNIFKAPRLTGYGSAWIDRMKTAFGPKVNEGADRLDDDYQLILASLFGLGMLTMLPYSYIDRHLGASNQTAWLADSSGGGSCGSGSSCSSGSSCGGGGCGGCGGCS